MYGDIFSQLPHGTNNADVVVKFRKKEHIKTPKTTKLQLKSGRLFGHQTAFNTRCCDYKNADKSRSVESNQTKSRAQHGWA